LPDELLNDLHKHFPATALCIHTRTLDQAVLRSPQLHRLAIALPHAYDRPIETARLWKQLKEALILCHNLRALSLDVHPHSNKASALQNMQQASPLREAGLPHDDLATNKVWLPVEPGDKLPTLEEFEIRASNYSLDAAHCNQMLECMDLTKLKHLVVGPSDATPFFEVFATKLPQLESLDFTYSHQRSYCAPSAAHNSKADARAQLMKSACAQLLRSIQKLKALTVRCDTIDMRDRLWRDLADLHGDHLQRLSFRSYHEGLEAPVYKIGLASLLFRFSVLDTLDLPFGTAVPQSLKYGAYCPVLEALAHSRVSVRFP
jgi:hypothetical protein